MSGVRLGWGPTQALRFAIPRGANLVAMVTAVALVAATALAAVGALAAVVLVSAAPVAAQPPDSIPESGARVDLVLPEPMRIGESTLMGGHIEAEATLQDPGIASARALRFLPGNLTVCPIGTGNQSRLMALLRQADRDCAQGQTFTEAQVRFGPATDLAMAGEYPIASWPEATVAALYGEDVLAILVETVRFEAPGNGTRFLTLGRQAAVEVTQAGETHWFNGTRYAFLHDGAGLGADADGIIGTVVAPSTPPGAAAWPGTVFRVAPADAAALQAALRPETLLDLQALRFGADEREPRANATRLLREFGRVPEMTNGAVFGALAGSAGPLRLDGGYSLLRGDGFTLVWAEGRLQGVYSPTLALTPAGVALGDDAVRGPPWTAAIILVVITAVVMAVRRAAPVRPWLYRLLWLGLGLVAFATVDLAVVRPAIGASLLASTSGPLGAAAALGAFAAATVLLAYLLLALPARAALGRMVPNRWLLVAEGVVGALWLMALLVFPATFLALGHAVARL